MTPDDIEFQISQYLDGTLSAEERAAVELHLANDADARKLLAEYRRLDEHLSQASPLPNVKWGRLAEHLSAFVNEAPIVAGRIGPATWVRRLAIAACMALAVGLTVHRYQTHHISAQPDVDMVSLITGPGPEPTDQTPVQEISIGPSEEIELHGDGGRYSQTNPTLPGRAFIIPASAVHGS